MSEIILFCCKKSTPYGPTDHLGSDHQVEDFDEIGPPLRNALDFTPHTSKRHVKHVAPPPKSMKSAHFQDRFRSLASMIPKEVADLGANARHYDQKYRHFGLDTMFEPGVEPDAPGCVDGETIHRTFFYFF